MKTKPGIFYTVFLLFLLYCIFVSPADAVNRIMPLGDSITDGGGIFGETAYRRTLYLLLTGAGYETDFVGSFALGIPNDFDRDHEGHPGWRDDEIVYGRLSSPEEGKLSDWLEDFQPQIVLLHIGTNFVDANPADVEAILDEIDAFSPDVWVVLARIINRNCSLDTPPCPRSLATMAFNDNIEDMALDRIINPANPAFPDKIEIVDMETGADLDYRLQPVGDMVDNLHPWETGYNKMADVWFAGLLRILPRANAGSVQTVKEMATVTLNGSNSSDPDGTISSNLWEQIAGTPVTLSGSFSARPTFTAPDVAAAGETLRFRLTVTDNDGLESTDSVRINVIDRINPSANAGIDLDVKEGATVTLDGSGSFDRDGTIVSYRWEQTAGSPVTLSGSFSARSTFTAPDVAAAGETLSFRLTVTDDDGLKSTDTVIINVIDRINPTANAGVDQNVKEGATVTLDGSGSFDRDGTIVSYRWEQIGGTPVALSAPFSIRTTFTAPDVAAAGETLTFRLTVTDNDGLKSTDSIKVIISNRFNPVADAGADQNVEAGAPVTLNGSNSRDADGSIAFYSWVQTAGPTVQLTGAATATAAFTAPGVGPAGATLVFQLTVTDNDNLKDVDTVTIAVSVKDICPNDPAKTVPGICGCGITDVDSDGDGTPDCDDSCDGDPDKAEPGICGCGVQDVDTDGDGTLDCIDNCPNDPDKTEPGTCGCGATEADTDGDGIFDCVDTNGDNDGVTDTEEQGPDGNDPDYDGNHDGVADRLQKNVTSLHTYDKSNYVTIESPAGTSIVNLKAVSNPSAADAPSRTNFSYGFFDFTITGADNGGATTVTLYFPAGTAFDTYYKYGPTPDEDSDHWYEFLFDGRTGAEIDGHVITLHFEDGNKGDDDLAADGIVIDIGGPAASLNPVDTDSDIGSGGGGGGGCFIGSAANGFQW